jgi:hypothetical protein
MCEKTKASTLEEFCDKPQPCCVDPKRRELASLAAGKADGPLSITRLATSQKVVKASPRYL